MSVLQYAPVKIDFLTLLPCSSQKKKNFVALLATTRQVFLDGRVRARVGEGLKFWQGSRCFLSASMHTEHLIICRSSQCVRQRRQVLCARLDHVRAFLHSTSPVGGDYYRAQGLSLHLSSLRAWTLRLVEHVQGHRCRAADAKGVFGMVFEVSSCLLG
jgi:hypothetical protein